MANPRPLRSSSARGGDLLARLSFGGRVPWGVGLLLVVTIATSLVAAVGSRHVLPLFELGALVPDEVMRGEVWRLITWSVMEPSPISLLFACLILYWFGRDLAGVWGSRRFLSVYGGVAVVASVGTCLIALVDKPIGSQVYVGSWPLAEAMTVAWGLWFPDRVIRIYFVIPIRGFWLAWLTVGLTVLYALYFGWDHLVPNLLAEGAMLAWLYRAPVVSRWAAWRRSSQIAAQKRSRARAKDEQRMATVHVLRKIEAQDDDLAELSPEMKARLGFSDAGKDAKDGGDGSKPKRDDEKPN